MSFAVMVELVRRMVVARAPFCAVLQMGNPDRAPFCAKTERRTALYENVVARKPANFLWFCFACCAPRNGGRHGSVSTERKSVPMAYQPSLVHRRHTIVPKRQETLFRVLPPKTSWAIGNIRRPATRS